MRLLGALLLGAQFQRLTATYRILSSKNGTVSLWYKDNKQDTVDQALEAANWGDSRI
jgi:hypothetical protein